MRDFHAVGFEEVGDGAGPALGGKDDDAVETAGSDMREVGQRGEAGAVETGLDDGEVAGREENRGFWKGVAGRCAERGHVDDSCAGRHGVGGM